MGILPTFTSGVDCYATLQEGSLNPRYGRLKMDILLNALFIKINNSHKTKFVFSNNRYTFREAINKSNLQKTEILNMDSNYSNQNYVASELTHFVGRSLPNNDERYSLLITIIKTGLIITRNQNRRGALIAHINPNIGISSNDMFNPDMVCFCDIPCSDFKIHMNKYSKFGISFKKDFLISQGVRPVFYIPLRTVVTKKNIEEIFDDNAQKLRQLIEQYNTNWLEMEHFVDFQIFSFIKFYNPDLDDNDPDNFYMEREWRGLERIEFKIDNISRITIPSCYIKKLFQDVPEYCSQVSTIE